MAHGRYAWLRRWKITAAFIALARANIEALRGAPAPTGANEAARDGSIVPFVPAVQAQGPPN